MHGKKFRMQMVNSKTLKNHTSPPNFLKPRIQQFRNFLCSLNQCKHNIFRYVKYITSIMLLWNHNSKTRRVRKDRQKCKMFLIFPYIITRNAACNNFTEYTIIFHYFIKVWGFLIIPMPTSSQHPFSISASLSSQAASPLSPSACKASATKV